MAFELRVPDRDDFVAFMDPVWRAFGEPAPSDEEVDDERLLWDPERSLGAVDGSEWVGATGAFTFELTLPGGTTAPAAGVTMIGVAQTHRRRGVLTALMTAQLDDVAERGDPFAILTASESSIYGRFGYGPGTFTSAFELRTDRSRFREPVDGAGRLRVVRLADAGGAMAAAYERCRRQRAGAVDRRKEYWQLVQRDRSSRRGGASALFVVVHTDEGGDPDGYATYRIKQRWPSGLPDHTAVVTDLYGADPGIEATLWRFLCDIDLVATVHARGRPDDDPVRWRLVEPRQLRTTDMSDWLWVRVLDVPAALAARRYACEDTLVLSVEDRFRPASGGRFRLDTGRDDASCEPTDAGADLILGAEELGAMVLGGVAPSLLARAGRIDEPTRGALARADAAFVCDPRPFCGTMF